MLVEDILIVLLRWLWQISELSFDPSVSSDIYFLGSSRVRELYYLL